MPYNEKILKYARSREMYGELPDVKETGIGYTGNAACGDMLKIYLKVSDDNIIEDVKVKAYGCGCAIASTALAAEKLKGKTLDDALKLRDKDLADELELPKIKIHCSVLAAAAIKCAVENYQKKQSGEWQEIEVSRKMFEDVSKEAQSCCVTREKTECCNTKEPAKQSFTITPKAHKRFKQILEMYPGNIGVLISSEAGGCAGNSYALDVVSEHPEGAKLYEFEDLKVFVPQEALMFVLGVTIDYEETETQAGFRFTHPKLKTCGCGESFR